MLILILRAQLVVLSFSSCGFAMIGSKGMDDGWTDRYEASLSAERSEGVVVGSELSFVGEDAPGRHGSCRKKDARGWIAAYYSPLSLCL